jgi:hypothetical protein
MHAQPRASAEAAAVVYPCLDIPLDLSLLAITWSSSDSILLPQIRAEKALSLRS